MQQNQQHRVQTTKLYYNAAKKYKKPIPAETGRNLKYDIKDLRKRPEKLTQSYQEQQKGEDRTQQPNHDWRERGEYQQTLGKLLVKTYPLKRKDTKAKEPEWTQHLEEWGTEKRDRGPNICPRKEREISYKKK